MDTIKPCRNCNNRCIDSLRTYPEQICRPCLKMLSRTICMYCQKDFHQLQHLENSDKSICWKCTAAQKEHGDPLPCHFCCQKAAFGQKICRHCQKDSEKYGTPISCDSCKKKCAFLKPFDLKQKVGGKNLCYLCTRSYKLMQHRNKKQNCAIIDLDHNNNNNNNNKRSLSEIGINNDDNKNNKRMRTMCFGCKSIKHSFDEYKKQMESALSDTFLRVDDYRQMAEKAKRKADQYRREKLSNVERIGELNGSLEKERRKYHRDISVKREHSENENKRLRQQLNVAQISLNETQKRVDQLQKNNEILKKNKKEFEKIQKQRICDKNEYDKKYQKLEEKLNSKREKLKDWKMAYDHIIAEKGELNVQINNMKQEINTFKERENKYITLIAEKEDEIKENKTNNNNVNNNNNNNNVSYHQRLMQQIVDSLSNTERDKLHGMNRSDQEKWFQSKMVQHQQQYQHKDNNNNKDNNNKNNAQFAASLTQQQMLNLTQRGYTVQPSPNQRGYIIIPPTPQYSNQTMFIQPQYQSIYGIPQQQIYIQQQQPNKNQQQIKQQY